tara:strand:- start:625 stop:753 length:129 start_codon:yes stop_codon:yes gene_type:complete
MYWKLLWQILFVITIILFIVMFIKFAIAGFVGLKELLKKNNE